jgi:F0F1-type ATP synthase membrane subunit b/b'
MQSIDRRSIGQMKKTPFLIVAILISATPAFAGGGGGGHVGSIADLLWPWVNFSLYLLILGALLKKPFAQAWKSRREGIEQAVTTGAKELQQAESVLLFARSRSENLETDCKQLSQSILQDAKREGAQLLEEAKRRTEFLASQAAATVTAEQLQAERLLRQEIAERVLNRAKELLKSELGPEVDRELRRGVLAGVRHLSQ